MGTSPSSGGPTGPRFAVVGGGIATPEEVAAIAAALELVLAAAPAGPPPLSRWRWSGRRSATSPLNWRDPGATAHPSRP